MRFLILASWVWVGLGAVAFGENWGMWRGPRLDGRSEDSGFPVAATGETVAWKMGLHGEGHASPIVWGDKVYAVSCDAGTEDRLLICLDRNSGRVVWESVVLKSPLEGKHRLNSHASEHAGDGWGAGVHGVFGS